MDTDNWHWQVSFKVGPHMINVRTDDRAQMLEELRWISDNAAELRAHTLALDLQAPPEQATARPASAPAPAPDRPSPAPVTQNLAAQELGPLPVQKVDVTEGVSKNGKPYTRFVVMVGNVKCSTFDTLLGAAAKNLLGKPCYFSATKGNYGYELETIRAA